MRRDLFLISGLFLFLELAFIRWFPAQVLFLTFFTNTVLLASFLGLSLGCLAASWKTDFLRFTPLLLALGLTAGEAMEWLRLKLQDILDVGGNKSSPQVVFFGAEVKVADVAQFVVPMEVVAALFFVLIAAILIGPGQHLGRLFAKIGNPVSAYIWNIAGSLAGVLLFQLCAWILPPVGWFTIIAAGLVYLLLRVQAPRWTLAPAALVPLILILPQATSLGIIRDQYPEEIWSPYYRINYSPKSKTIVVNLLGHQTMVSRKDPFPAYALPWLINRDAAQPAFQDILIIGAGSGNDLSRALQFAPSNARIDAVEIDPVIQRLGKRDHPDRPYDDPRVTLHLNDGRNFLRSTNRKYDLVIFALIDSLVLHSSQSNLRLESYLFTEESFRDVARCLKPNGLFAMYNYFRRGWIVSRLQQTLQAATGRPPVVLTFPSQDVVEVDGRADAFTLFLSGPRSEALAQAFATRGTYRVPAGVAPTPETPNGFEPASINAITFQPTRVENAPELLNATDDWPFLYMRSPLIPEITWRGILLLGGLSLALLWIFGWRTSRKERTSGNGAMLLLGAGFLLLESKAVVQMALLFGSTWLVNLVVFAGILVMILGANLFVQRVQPRNLLPYLIGLLASLALNAFFPISSLLGLPQIAQALVAGILLVLPVGFAGILFATLLSRHQHPEQALAYNTAGAMLGGLLENVSMLTGFWWLLAIAGAIYVAAYALSARDHASPGAQSA